MSAAEEMTLTRIRTLQIADCDMSIEPSEPRPEADKLLAEAGGVTGLRQI
jgi:hypothetical protein